MAHKRLDLGVLGTTGLKEQSGYIFEEFLPRLQQPRGTQVYKEMRDNSSVVGALLFAIQNLIRQAEWRIEPASDTPEAKQWAEFVEGALTDMSHTWEEFIIEVLSMLPFGWSYHEIVYKLRRGKSRDPRFNSKFDDGLIGWRKFPIRSQDTLWKWEFAPDGSSLRGMWQFSYYGTQTTSHAFVPIEKALLFRNEGHKNNPEGRSILRNAVVDWHGLKRIKQIEAVGIERDMTGLLTMEVPIEILSVNPGPDELAIRNDLQKMLSELKRDEREFAMVPSEQDSEGNPTGYKLKLLSTGGRRQVDTNAVINRYSRFILMSVVAEVLMLGTDAGSWALASSKTRLLGMSIGAIMDSIASVFNRFGISRLMELNNVPVDLHPIVVHGDIETPPLDELGRYVTALAAAGVPLNDAAERKLLELGRLPVTPVDETTMSLPGEGEAQQETEE